jgi:hypothetical protein
MGPVELGGRLRQEASKWLDRHVPRLASGPALRRKAMPALPSRHFFPGALDERTLSALDARVPDARPRVVADAEAVMGGRFDLLGYRGLDFGDPVEWSLDPVSGRRAPMGHWTTLDPLDGETIGDTKVIWELSRHHWLVRLGQAYRLTGDERFAQVFARHIIGWIETNPRGMGINWASSLEVALRLISWCWALHLFHGSRVLTAELQAHILTSLSSHAAHVERYLSYYFSPNTHLTGEALGLFYAGTLFPDLPHAGRWQVVGQRILEEESVRQILPDGVYFEQSTCYQRYTAEIYLHFLILAERSVIAVSADVKDRVGSLLDALLALLRPDRSMPQIGDADGGWLLPLDVRSPDDARGVFSTAAVLFRRPEYAWAATGLAPETLWLLGPTAVDRFNALTPAPPRSAPSRSLGDGGYVVLRTSWQEDADQITLDTGPLGCPYSSGHGHADLLAIQCVFRGRPYVVDPGTFAYMTDPGWRSYFRGTAAHSTVEVDGLGQATPRGPFAWDGRPHARLLVWGAGRDLDFAEAEHDAYGRLRGAVSHRRKVILVKSGYCVVVDDLAGGGEHRLDLRFQLARLPVLLDPDQWVRVGQATGGGLFIRAFSTVPLKAVVAEGEVEPRQGWISSDYGVRTPAPMLVYSVVGPLPVRIVTLLFPADQIKVAPRVSAIVEGGVLSALAVDEAHETLRLGQVGAPVLEKR